MTSKHLFESLADLYDEEMYQELESKCQSLLDQYSIDEYERHITYSFLALAQIRNNLPEAALKNAEYSLRFSESCPWSRWVMLFALEASIKNTDSDLIEKAVTLGSSIIEDGITHIQKDPCSNNLPPRSQLALLNDSRFLLAFVHIAAGNLTEGKNLLVKYLEHVEDTDSDFQSFEAEAELKRLQQAFT